MRTLLYRILILLAVFGLVFTPPLLTGYVTLEQADIAMKSGDFILAGKLYRRAVILLPWKVDIWEQTGNAYYFAGNSQGIIYNFEQARERKALSARGYEWLGQAYFITSDFEAAKQIWSLGLDIYPTHAKYYYYLSLVYAYQGNLLSEQDSLEHWVKLNGEPDASAHYRLGLLLSISEPDRAVEEFMLASSLDPEYESAVETMRTTLNLASLESDESRRLVLIGRGLGLVNEWELASEAYRQAVTADGENAEAWAWLGEAEQQLGRDGRAELNKALSIDYKNPIVHSLSGLYWLRQGQPGITLSEYKLAAIYDPDNPAWQISIGEAYALNGDLQAALASYYRATELAPNDATVWRLLASFSAQYNMQVEQVGLPAAQIAVELTGEVPLALDVLGWNLALLERFDEAQDALEHALNLDPELAQGHLHLGIVLMQTEDWDAAHEHLQQARDLDPNGPIGEQAQRLLNQYFP